MPDIHHAIAIAAPAESVATLVSTAEGFRQWWAEDVEAGSDGSVTLGFFNRATLYRLRLVERGPNRVAWHCTTGQEWQGTDLVFTLASAPTGLLVDFAHANWKEATPYFRSCNTTWGGLMFRLRSAAEGHAQGPLFRSDSLAY